MARRPIDNQDIPSEMTPANKEKVDWLCKVCEIPADDPLYSRKPKGSLLIIGGHEDKGYSKDAPGIIRKERATNKFDILSRLIAKTEHQSKTIEIIAAASSIPDEMELMYVKAYKDYGFDGVNVIDIDEEKDLSNPEYIKRVKAAHAVFFTGGDQLQLTGRLCGSPLLQTIRQRYYDDPTFIISGTSAGAMSLGRVIIGRGYIDEALLKCDLKLGNGFGMLPNIIVDTHFIARGRFGRLALAVGTHPECVGIGLGEDAALFVSKGNECESCGSGAVIIIDGRKMGKSNIKSNTDYEPISMEHLNVSIVAYGSKYNIDTGTVTLREAQLPDALKA